MITSARCSAWLAGLALAFASAAPAEDRFRPQDPDHVVLELPRRADSDRRSSVAAARGDPVAAAQLAEAYVQRARTWREPRYFGRAEAIVAPWAKRPGAPPALLLLHADILQQRHDFKAALRVLDAVIDRNPRDPNALSMRASVQLVRGELAAAKRDCTSLLNAGSMWVGTACLAQVLGSTGQIDRAARMLETLDSSQAAVRAADAAWLLSIRADLETRRGRTIEAERLLRRALNLQPQNEAVRIALADRLIDRDRFSDALEAVRLDRPSVALLLRRVLAAHASGSPDRASLRRLEELLLLDRRRGERVHRREEAWLALDVTRDPALALALARDNFAVQRETDDVRLVARAARLAGDADTTAMIAAWVDRTGYQDDLVTRLLRRPGT